MAELKKKKKHDHKLTDWLKIIIFGLIMIAPFFAILVPCVYVSFNPNAKDSYYGETINESEKIVINDIYKLKQNYNYEFNTNVITNLNFTITDNIYRIYIDNVNVIINPTTYDLTLSKSIGFYHINTMESVYIYFFDANNTVITSRSSINSNTLITFNLVSIDLTLKDLITNCDFISEIIYNRYSFLDNAFTYSVNQMVNSPVFNWTQNTGMYNVINSMTSDLEMSEGGNILATLLTYWSLNTAIYIIFDIIIWAFTKITHMFNE